MTPIDMTTEIGSFLAALDIVLVIAATAIAVSAWRYQCASLTFGAGAESKPTVVGNPSSASVPMEEASGDPSFPEAA